MSPDTEPEPDTEPDSDSEPEPAPLPTMRPATEADLPAVFALLTEAAERLAEHGVEQWPTRFERDGGWRARRIEEYVADGYLYLGSDDRGYVATITLSPHADPDFAHAWPGGPEDALYIFRFAIAGRVAGHHVGEHLLAWAADRAARAGKSWLRVDVHRRNEELHRYYERMGFTRVGTVVTPPRRSGALYQRPSARLGSSSDR
ncbi:GNAT family N-acetyltransferase [Actinopolymorpha rutila]|uniref:Ribosomal protein S18 acetylase RimI-like enzyme n=1 Tax=Actinopolymorpha rutila TaxID=446787 RepID=A0A852ZTV3_9ACTN|nr:GNAT family N-acetyltransferase [Actinopolymorpha rutila]NYH92086.1 ribosomal protein S18 acetylase RimI-like enzyme [Actinopolymorpha rutila]